MRWFGATLSSVDNHTRRSDKQHRESEFLSSREGREIQADLRIGLAHKLDQKSEQSIKGQQRPKDGSAIEILFVNPFQDEKQEQAFQQRLVKLRWMTRRGAAFGKNHRPRDVGWTSEQLAVDEIADAP